MNDISSSPWYVCFTKPRQEQHAASKLLEQGYEVYLPALESWARQSGHWCKTKSVMFPRYGFVRPGRAAQAVGPIASTPGITSLVRFGHVLAVMADDRLHALRTLALAHAAAIPQEPFNTSQQVVFCAGPLKGAYGIVSKVALERISVMMTLLGSDQTIRAQREDLACA